MKKVLSVLSLIAILGISTPAFAAPHAPGGPGGPPGHGPAGARVHAGVHQGHHVAPPPPRHVIRRHGISVYAGYPRHSYRNCYRSCYWGDPRCYYRLGYDGICPPYVPIGGMGFSIRF